MLKAGLTGIVVLALVGAAHAADGNQAKGDVVLNGTIATLTAPSTDSGPVAQVKPGERLTITGDCVDDAESADALRVMLTLAGESTAKSGFHVLATDQSIDDDGLNVRVPDLPETANRDFNVRVFRLGQDAPQMCNAGTIHVGTPSKGHLG
jgi:hypothetical protein